MKRVRTQNLESMLKAGPYHKCICGGRLDVTRQLRVQLFDWPKWVFKVCPECAERLRLVLGRFEERR